MFCEGLRWLLENIRKEKLNIKEGGQGSKLWSKTVFQALSTSWNTVPTNIQKYKNYVIHCLREVLTIEANNLGMEKLQRFKAQLSKSLCKKIISSFNSKCILQDSKKVEVIVKIK